MDFLQIMRILRDTQFAGSICPDHMLRHPDDPGGPSVITQNRPLMIT
jgi:hypothetical protein